MSFEDKLQKLGLKLPEAPKPLGAYLPAVRAGDLLFLSGVLPKQGDKLAYEGKLGKELNLEQGREAAKVAILNAIAIIKAELGSLNRVVRIVKLVGYVASAENFTAQPKVIDAASELLGEIFGEQGEHARVAVGAAALPLNAPVELELVVQVKK